SIAGINLSRRHGTNHNPFVTREISYSPGDALFMFTDGMVDQLGGKDNRKFNKQHFRNLLLDIYAHGLQQGMEICNDALRSWQGENAQTDDILIVGVRF